MLLGSADGESRAAAAAPPLGDARAEGEDDLDGALDADRGVILLTAHLGNWELGGRLLEPRLQRTTHVVLSAEQDAALEPYMRADTPSLRFVTRRQATSTLGLLAALRRGEAVAMQGDQLDLIALAPGIVAAAFCAAAGAALVAAGLGPEDDDG